MFRHCINRTRCQPSDPSTDSVPPSMSIPMTTEQRMWQKVRIIIVTRAARLLDRGTTHFVAFRDESKNLLSNDRLFSNA